MPVGGVPGVVGLPLGREIVQGGLRFGCPDGGSHQSHEERVRRQRSGGQFRVELGTDEVGMLGRFQLQHVKMWVWYLWKTALFLAIKKSFITANMPELVQGGRLKIDCVRTRGFEPHCWHFFNIKNYNTYKIFY